MFFEALGCLELGGLRPQLGLGARMCREQVGVGEELLHQQAHVAWRSSAGLSGLPCLGCGPGAGLSLNLRAAAAPRTPGRCVVSRVLSSGRGRPPLLPAFSMEAGGSQHRP